MSNGQSLTRRSYQDPLIVEKYIQRNAQFIDADLLQSFTDRIKGTKILDLGCGPGHYSHALAEKGYEVTGLDYSSEMINRARNFKQSMNQPEFVVGDMKKLDTYFETDTFDAVWAMASLLHIPKAEIPRVLAGINNVTKGNSPIFIAIKQGEGTKLVNENLLDDITIQREFTLWDKDEFVSIAKDFGLDLVAFSTREGRVFLGKPTIWLQFFFELRKNSDYDKK